jgi:GT2 family glycosyltransferase
VSGALVSVVVPTYNRAYCLERAVDSALGQSHSDVEVILVDDGSKDDTRALVERRYGGEPRVRYHYQKNTGISGARNTGLGLVRGDYVALLDSDDWWFPWKLELQLACMRAHPELGMTWTEMIAVGPDGKVVNPAYLRTMYSAYKWFPTAGDLFPKSESIDRYAPRGAEIPPGRRFYWGDIGAQMLLGNMVHTSTVVLTAARARSIRAFREDLRHAGEDYEFHLRTCREGQVGYLDLSSIHYQVGNTDQATKPENGIHMAVNFLNVIEPILTAERDKLALPRHMQDIVLAEAYEWVGELRLELNERPAARHALYRALRTRPQARTARLLLGAYLPSPVLTAARRAFRALRGTPSAKAQ